MVKMVEQMLSLNKQLASSKTAHDKTILQRQIAATEIGGAADARPLSTKNKS
jgi:hypothetical protein